MQAKIEDDGSEVSAVLVAARNVAKRQFEGFYEGPEVYARDGFEREDLFLKVRVCLTPTVGPPEKFGLLGTPRALLAYLRAPGATLPAVPAGAVYWTAPEPPVDAAPPPCARCGGSGKIGRSESCQRAGCMDDACRLPCPECKAQPGFADRVVERILADVERETVRLAERAIAIAIATFTEPVRDSGTQLRCVRCGLGIAEGAPRVPVYSGGFSVYRDGRPIRSDEDLYGPPRVHFRCLDAAECEWAHGESHAAAVAHFDGIIRRDPEIHFGYSSYRPEFYAEEVASIRAAGPPPYASDPERFDP